MSLGSYTPPGYAPPGYVPPSLVASPGTRPPPYSGNLRRAIYAALLADPRVQFLVDSRIAPAQGQGRSVKLPAGLTPPAVTFRVISNVPGRVLGGPSGIAMARVQVDSWSLDLGQCETMNEVLREVVTGFRGSLQDIAVTGAWKLDEYDHAEEPAADGDRPLLRISTDYRLMYRESRSAPAPAATSGGIVTAAWPATSLGFSVAAGTYRLTDGRVVEVPQAVEGPGATPSGVTYVWVEPDGSVVAAGELDFPVAAGSYRLTDGSTVTVATPQAVTVSPSTTTYVWVDPDGTIQRGP